MAHYQLVIKEEAKNEIKDGYEWYESKQVNLGLRFIESIERCFISIQQSPKLYAKIFYEYRKAIVSNFPYVVIYEIENRSIIVYAVFHTSRNPAIWKKRK